MIFLDIFLRREAPYRRRSLAPIRRVLVGGGVVPGSSTPGSECWPEEDVLRASELRRSRGDDLFGCFPPAGSPSTEVLLFFKLLLRQTTSSPQRRQLGEVRL